MKKVIILSVAIFLLSFQITSAHQPRIPEGNTTIVTDPEISKAYYSELKGIPQSYSISSDTTFSLYVNIVVPDIEWQKKDISVIIVKDGESENPFAILDGNTFTWTQFFEPFGYDTYWKWPTYKGVVSAGKYDIIVFSTNNDSKYSLAIGEVERFHFPEIMNALSLTPKIKRDFFGESPMSFILSPFGSGLIWVMFMLAFIFWFLYRWILRSFTKNTLRKASKNIDLKGRLFRIAIWCFLLILAITTSWSPILLFFAGFAFFEAIFSWCGLFAALGKSSCSIN